MSVPCYSDYYVKYFALYDLDFFSPDVFSSILKKSNFLIFERGFDFFLNPFRYHNFVVFRIFSFDLSNLFILFNPFVVVGYSDINSLELLGSNLVFPLGIISNFSFGSPRVYYGLFDGVKKPLIPCDDEGFYYFSAGVYPVNICNRYYHNLFLSSFFSGSSFSSSGTCNLHLVHPANPFDDVKALPPDLDNPLYTVRISPVSFSLSPNLDLLYILKFKKNIKANISRFLFGDYSKFQSYFFSKFSVYDFSILDTYLFSFAFVYYVLSLDPEIKDLLDYVLSDKFYNSVRSGYLDYFSFVLNKYSKFIGFSSSDDIFQSIFNFASFLTGKSYNFDILDFYSAFKDILFFVGGVLNAKI